MALRAPSVVVQRRTRVVLEFPDPAIAAEVHELAGPTVEIRRTGEATLTAERTVRSGPALEAEGRDWPRFDGDAVETVEVGWTELNDVAKVAGTFQPGDPDVVRIDCSWPPERVQRRAFRRFPLELPVWVLRRRGARPVLDGVTRDLSGGGAAVQITDLGPADPLTVDEPVVVMIRCEDRDLLVPSSVNRVSDSRDLIGLSFDTITQADQDHLVRLVSLAEAARGR